MMVMDVTTNDSDEMERFMPKLTYIGHSAFTIEHEGNQIAVDPFITGNPVATISADDVSPSTILLTHAHNDHVGDTVPIGKRTGAQVITTVELADYLEQQGVNTSPCNHGGTVEFEGGSVKFVPAWHSSAYTLEDGSVVAPGVPAGLIVFIGDKKIYFAGDTCLFLDMQLIGEEELDVAVLPIGDNYTMGPKDGIRATKFLRPRHVIPCHVNTFSLIEQDVDAFSKEIQDKTPSSPRVLQPGESWEID